jgi:sulfur carrier protein
MTEQTPPTVLLTINGEPRTVQQGATLARVVGEVTALNGGIAVALNGDVVPRGRWDSTPLAAGDQVEIVTAVQGG